MIYTLDTPRGLMSMNYVNEVRVTLVTVIRRVL